MKKMITLAAAAMALTLMAAGAAMATPSTQIWIPSTDIQPYKTFHLNIDNYIRTTKSGPTNNNVYDLGPTVGILPFEKVQAEVGFDYVDTGLNSPVDSHPFYLHGKLGTPEDSLFSGSPALAIGVYNVGTNYTTEQNISYALVARTLPVVGRISAGGYHGSKHVLVNASGNADNDGVLLSWDRTMNEISDKLWIGVDYMSGKNANGSTNFGFSWNFSKNVAVIFGYDIWNDLTTGGRNTFNTQLDINFP